LLPSTRVDTTSSARTSSVTFGPPVRITSMSACFSPRIPGRSERRGSMQVTTAIFGRGGPSPHAEALPPTLDYTSSHSVHWSAWSIMLMAISILIAPPTGSNRWRALVRVRKETTQGNTEEQGSGDQWSSESALLLIVQARNPEPVDRFLPRTGVGDLPHRRWLRLRSALLDIGRDVCLRHKADQFHRRCDVS
jgi:hypothetical protein